MRKPIQLTALILTIIGTVFSLALAREEPRPGPTEPPPPTPQYKLVMTQNGFSVSQFGAFAPSWQFSVQVQNTGNAPSPELTLKLECISPKAASIFFVPNFTWPLTQNVSALAPGQSYSWQTPYFKYSNPKEHYEFIATANALNSSQVLSNKLEFNFTY